MRLLMYVLGAADCITVFLVVVCLVGLDLLFYYFLVARRPFYTSIDGAVNVYSVY